MRYLTRSRGVRVVQDLSLVRFFRFVPGEATNLSVEVGEYRSRGFNSGLLVVEEPKR